MNVTEWATVEIPKEKLIGLVVDALYHMYTRSSEDKTLYRALANLVGKTDVEAVLIANRAARKKKTETITTEQFRRWLPQVLTEAFAELLRKET